MKKRLLVFSVDAMVREDVDKLMDMPNFGSVMKDSCQVDHIRTIYPSITYPAHTSISTGCYPHKHGIVSNFHFTTGDKEMAWIWDHKFVKVEDFFDCAKKNGYTTGAVGWPVTGNHKHIDYLWNECWMPFEGDTLETCFRREGSSDEVIEIIKKHSDKLPPTFHEGGRKNFMIEPYIDNFEIAVATDIIRTYKPEVMFVHTGIMDGTRHKYGVFNSETEKAIGFVDWQFGEIVKALKDADVFDLTNIAVISDHGQLSTRRILKPNVYLKDHGFITVDEDGKIVDWKAFCLSDAMSDLVYLKDPADKKTYDAVYDLLREMAEEGIYGFNEVLTAEEIDRREKLSGDFSFVLESDGYTSFSDGVNRPVIQPYDYRDYRFGRATHGYNPDLGPQPVFNVIGPDFRRNIVIERRPIVDEAPTLARAMGFDMPMAEGSAIYEFIK